MLIPHTNTHKKKKKKNPKRQNTWHFLFHTMNANTKTKKIESNKSLPENLFPIFFDYLSLPIFLFFLFLFSNFLGVLLVHCSRSLYLFRTIMHDVHLYIEIRIFIFCVHIEISRKWNELFCCHFSLVLVFYFARFVK